jgi:hypothetical protein
MSYEQRRHPGQLRVAEEEVPTRCEQAAGIERLYQESGNSDEDTDPALVWKPVLGGTPPH